MKRKRVLWLSHLLPYPPKGGVLQRSYNLLTEVSKCHEVTLLAFAQEGLLELHYGSITKGIEETVRELSGVCHEVKVVPMPLSSVPFSKHIIALTSLFTNYPYTLNWLNSKKYRNEIKNLLKDYNFDLIYCDTVSLAIYQDSFKSIPFVVGHHNIESDMMKRRSINETNWIKKIYFDIEAKKILKYERNLCKKASLNITCSALDSEKLRRALPASRISEIPNGVDLNYFVPEPRKLKGKKNITFLFAGRLNAYTNSKAALFIAKEIWPILRSHFSGSRFFIVGSNPPKEVLLLAENDDGLVVTGFVEDIRPYLRDSDIYICPISDGGGTKLKVLDALAMGIPIIANPIACEGIDVTEGENILFAEKPDQYARQAAKLLENEMRYHEFSANSINLIENCYSYTGIGKKLSQLLAEVAPQNSHHPSSTE